ncbi:hypothetical protein ANANG_G00305200 [Anguilla anguilla]|uniref:Uncharacterized protein n=1 Tax=Anguilla anguilla TaxID=7936 RepID=A0A9D3LLA5_ANGAN|nr:hypothetical protein ANANG_G00305200 [Anguilla anguilla]
MSNIIHSRPLSASSLGLGAGVPPGAGLGRGEHQQRVQVQLLRALQAAWKPRREALNIDSIFSRRQAATARWAPPPGGGRRRGGAGSGGSGRGGRGAGDEDGHDRRRDGAGHRRGTLPRPSPASWSWRAIPEEQQPPSLDTPLSESSCPGAHRDGVPKHFGPGPSWRSVPKSKSSSALLQDLKTSTRGSSHLGSLGGEGRSELDELQEEVTRRAKEQELQRKKEKEKEAAMGFNPRPSKFMDLDELQNQGKGDGFEQCLHEADALLEQSLQLEQADDMAAALSVCNQAVSKLRLTMHEGYANTHSRTVADKKLQRCMRRARGLQQRMQPQQEPQPPQPTQLTQTQGLPSEQPIPGQVLLTAAQLEDQEAEENATLGPPSPVHVKPLPHVEICPHRSLEPPASLPLPRWGVPMETGPQGGGRRAPGPAPGPGGGERDERGGAGAPPPWAGAQLADMVPDEGPHARHVRKHSVASLPSLSLDWDGPLMEGEAEPSPLSPRPRPWLRPRGPGGARTGTPSAPAPRFTHRRTRTLDPPCRWTPPQRGNTAASQRTPATGWPQTPTPETGPPGAWTGRTAWTRPSTPRPTATASRDAPPPPPRAGPPPAMPVERWAENVARYYNSQHAPEPDRGSPSPELSELDSLYQASLQASCAPRVLHSAHPLHSGKPAMAAARKLLSGMATPGRSKTPTAEIEGWPRPAAQNPTGPRLCASPPAHHHQPPSSVGQERLHCEDPSGPRLHCEDPSYSAENLRRIARSLSGTVIRTRPEQLTGSHSFEPSVARTTKHAEGRVSPAAEAHCDGPVRGHPGDSQKAHKFWLCLTGVKLSQRKLPQRGTELRHAATGTSADGLGVLAAQGQRPHGRAAPAAAPTATPTTPPSPTPATLPLPAASPLTGSPAPMAPTSTPSPVPHPPPPPPPAARGPRPARPARRAPSGDWRGGEYRKAPPRPTPTRTPTPPAPAAGPQARPYARGPRPRPALLPVPAGPRRALAVLLLLLRHVHVPLPAHQPLERPPQEGVNTARAALCGTPPTTPLGPALRRQRAAEQPTGPSPQPTLTWNAKLAAHSFA